MHFRDLWWLILLRGILLILFGLVAMFWPAITFVTLALVFAFFILLSGVFTIIDSVLEMKTHKYWFLLLILGVFELGIGAYALNNPGLTIATLVLLIGFTLVVRGVLEVISAFADVHEGATSRVFLIIVGVLGVLAGIIILRYPVSGTLAFTWVLGVYALIAGAITVALSISTKEVVEDMTTRPSSRRARA